MPGSLAEMDRPERLKRLRHSAAHVMAQAVLELFPDANIAIGPPIDTGFYYDFDLPRPLTPDERLKDLPWDSIEALKFLALVDESRVLGLDEFAEFACLLR